MADEQPEGQQSLSAEERRRNVRRVEESIDLLDGLEGQLVEIVLAASRMYGQLDRIHRELCAAVGKQEPYPIPPLIEKIAEAAKPKPKGGKRAAAST